MVVFFRVKKSIVFNFLLEKSLKIKVIQVTYRQKLVAYGARSDLSRQNLSNILQVIQFNNFLFLKVMLSFGKAPAKSCGRGNSSTLPDYLPEDDEDTVVSDKVSKEYPTQ